MHIDPSGLAAALAETPEEHVLPYEGNSYVMEHLYMPLQQDLPLCFAYLDFDAFSDDDIQELDHWIDEKRNVKNRLISLGHIFCAAQPVSRSNRVFC